MLIPEALKNCWLFKASEVFNDQKITKIKKHQWNWSRGGWMIWETVQMGSYDVETDFSKANLLTYSLQVYTMRRFTKKHHTRVVSLLQGHQRKVYEYASKGKTKSTGSDDSRKSARQLSKCLQLTFQTALKVSCYPQHWKAFLKHAYAEIGAKPDKNNYWSISLLCCFSKAFKTNKLACFRKGGSAMLQNLLYVDEVHHKKNDSSPEILLVINLEFTKAYDTVARHMLTRKLKKETSSRTQKKQPSHNWLYAHQHVGISNCSSASSKVTSGVTQGSLLSPRFGSINHSLTVWTQQCGLEHC